MHRAVLFVGTLKTLYKDYRYCPIKNVVKAVDAKSLCHKPSKDGERILMSYLASMSCDEICDRLVWQPYQVYASVF